MTSLDPTGQGSTTTLGKLGQLIPQLSEGDQVRLLQFAEAMVQQRAGKRSQRRGRLDKPIDESWRLNG
ncbi:MAG: hypothetical protein KME07_06310 [Pegethrix bostrychoides GSE-TBD4-15B]|jgi:ABC-type hemin transport system ATPase subunit|uniref:Uncharacterized protein n=1 Tax=Pegethrix bostrychoides GSE-TBD4-15B TaxID=2839662 RepID=A0A951P8S0_9CYAN|nr:hypothetical protein [Pegethrix bostrychoides GSE-TBD4-15B]